MKADALAVLRHAVEQRREEDMRTEEVEAALVFLQASATGQGALDGFRTGLSFENLSRRLAALLASYRGILQIIGPGL